ncbi:MAG: metallophosphoesterase [Planctomycetaceae bacterium]|nr:metallophosphoesterase [Planctomycetaceae bacterium]
MKSILASNLPAMLFAGSVILVYYLWARLWLTWIFRKLRKKETAKILTGRPGLCLHALAVFGLFCILYGFFVEPYRIRIQTIPVETDKLKNTSFRIVQISDLHCDKKTRLEEKLPGIINSLKPDIIVFTGDTINSESALPVFQDTMARMEAPLGKFAVGGNWDFSYWYTVPLFEGTGFDELQLNERTIEKNGETIAIAGVAYEKDAHYRRAVRKLHPDTYNILLYHTTDLIEACKDKPVDLYLSGHTHGGQVALPFYGALTTLSRHGKKYEAGLYRVNDTLLYVNRGIGMEGGWTPRVRFLSRPEIAVFDIRPKVEGDR